MGNISPGDMDQFIAAMRQTVAEMGLDPLYRD
jgi:hypothetical protein